jgi:hypothetical protein
MLADLKGWCHGNYAGFGQTGGKFTARVHTKKHICFYQSPLSHPRLLGMYKRKEDKKSVAPYTM